MKSSRNMLIRRLSRNLSGGRLPGQVLECKYEISKRFFLISPVARVFPGVLLMPVMTKNIRSIAISVLVILCHVAPVDATGYTLGGKEVWLKFCTGRGEGFDEKSSKAICHTALLMYWSGYTHSQHDSNEGPVLCPRTLDSSIVDAFVKYLNDTEFEEGTDFIFLANGYFKKNSQCK